MVITKYGHIHEGMQPLTIRIDHPTRRQVIQIHKKMEELFKDKRFGYTIDTHVSCCKGPQGVNYFLTIEFEDMVESEALADLLLGAINEQVRRTDGV